VHWVVLNEPSGYTIGNCLNGVHLNRTWKSDPTPTGYYDGGFIEGVYQSCGWVGVGFDQQLNGLSSSNCVSSASHGLSEFMYFENGHYIINDASATDGTPLETIRAPNHLPR
jgi:hypothetical protein